MPWLQENVSQNRLDPDFALSSLPHCHRLCTVIPSGTESFAQASDSVKSRDPASARSATNSQAFPPIHRLVGCPTLPRSLRKGGGPAAWSTSNSPPPRGEQKLAHSHRTRKRRHTVGLRSDKALHGSLPILRGHPSARVLLVGARRL
jgi:hypothetical protein